MVGAHNKSVGHVLVFLHKHIMTKSSSIRRDISGVRGFSRETLVALIADIESREWHRGFLAREGLPEEHPQASTTDDVECFFSVLRDSVGKDFTLKEVYYTYILYVCTQKLHFEPYYFTGFVWMEKGYKRIYEAP